MPVPAGGLDDGSLYTDLETVKATLGKSSTDDRDDLINSAINAACRAIDQRCGRYFYIDTHASPRTFRPRGHVVCDGGDTILSVDDIASADLTVETGSGIGTTSWTAVTAYELGPDNADARGRPWTRIRGAGAWVPVGGKVRITATWGWPVVPDEICQAAALLTARLYRRKDSPQGVVGSSEWGVARVSRFDPDVESLISPFVIPLVA
ncbi:phage gp6-like head-tail connector protein [Krasilnikovia sp. MM14-A1259]|uniref:phage gp6-like head-tail connector protein n=1 Tax=Krasilnikovia sp. MM14-A1259 TaxID=3373539 RepID=UPI00380B5925